MASRVAEKPPMKFGGFLRGFVAPRSGGGIVITSGMKLAASVMMPLILM